MAWRIKHRPRPCELVKDRRGNLIEIRFPRPVPPVMVIEDLPEVLPCYWHESDNCEWCRAHKPWARTAFETRPPVLVPWINTLYDLLVKVNADRKDWNKPVTFRHGKNWLPMRTPDLIRKAMKGAL